MGLFDGLIKDIKNAVNREVKTGVRNAGKDAVNSIANGIKYQDKTFTFEKIPTSLAELKALPEASLKDPFATAALTILALNVYAVNADTCIEMMRFLKGPGELFPREIQFLADRYREAKNAPKSYFDGATPANDYTPSVPYKLTFREGAHSKDSAGYFKAFITSGGADSDRYVILRNKPSTGEWFLHEYEGLLAGIKTAKSDDPWA